MSDDGETRMSPAHQKAAMLKPTVIGVAIIVALGLSLATFALLRYLDQVESREFDLSRLTQAHRQLSHLKQETLDAARAMPGYLELKQAGILSPLEKTQEIDQFERLASTRPAGVRSFSLGGIDVLTPPADLPLLNLELGRHELTFDATPRHEIHLLGLLDDLQRTLNGLALLRTCSMQRSISMNRTSSDESKKSVAAGNVKLQAQCSIDWYLFKEREQITQEAVAAPIPQDFM